MNNELPTIPEGFVSDGVYHCCIRCGWIPLEEMLGYISIHGVKAKCLMCDYRLVERGITWAGKVFQL